MTPHVTYTLDRNFTRPTLVSAFSLLSHRPRDVTVRLLYTEDPGAGLAAVEKLARRFPEADVSARYTPEIVHAHAGRSHVSSAGLSRLLLPRIMDHPTLYLDGDTLIRRDIGDVFKIDRCGKPIAAVRDIGIRKTVLAQAAGSGRSRKQRTNWDYLERCKDLFDADTYFNSGVILFDFPAIEAAGLTERMQDVDAAVQLREDRGLRFDDQTWLNTVFHGQTHHLPAEWNTFWGNRLSAKPPFSDEDADTFRTSREDPAIVHFVGKVRPWEVRFPQLHPKRQPWMNVYRDVMREAADILDAL